MIDDLSKPALHAALVATLEAELERLLAATDAAREAATHEEARPENDKDTRALEASYLARGHAARVEALGEVITRTRFLDVRERAPDAPIDPGCLVELSVEDEDGNIESKRLLLVEVGGGTTLSVAGASVQTLTPAAPLGRALSGRRAGDDFELRVARKELSYSIEHVR